MGVLVGEVSDCWVWARRMFQVACLSRVMVIYSLAERLSNFKVPLEVQVRYYSVALYHIVGTHS